MNIATLTLNPTIDVAYEVDHVYHTRKMRTKTEFYSPGGGGINVARVYVRLGGNARSYYLSGGATGHALDGLLDLHQLGAVGVLWLLLDRLASPALGAPGLAHVRLDTTDQGK